jgi:hypothetical protein
LDILSLQRSAGNKAIARYLGAQRNSGPAGAAPAAFGVPLMMSPDAEDPLAVAAQTLARAVRGRADHADELSQALQDGDRRLQRKEVDKSAVASNRASIAPGDWLAMDRREWELASAHGWESRLSPTNTFMRAVYHNTQNLRPQEYQTVRERHDYYDLISYVLQFDRGTPKALRDIRFFHATTAVTGSPGIGTVDTALGAVKLSQDTRQILREVNVELFALNMGIIQKLLFNWKEPRDPTGTSTDAIGSFQFDLRMVETEQSAVEGYIRQNQKRFTPRVTGEINDSIDPDTFGQWFNFSEDTLEWAQKVLKTKKLDFLNITHRKAIGFANVHKFHRKSYSDFELFFLAYSIVPPLYNKPQADKVPLAPQPTP